MTDPVRMRADQLSVGDLVPDAYLPHRFNKGPAEVRFVADDGEGHTFFAFRYPNGQHDSTTVLSESALEIWPAPADTGLDYSRPADSDDPQPSGGREPMHTGGMTERGLVDETRPDPTGLDEVSDAALREILHWNAGGLVLGFNIACGAESGPFTKRRDKATCPACLSAEPVAHVSVVGTVTECGLPISSLPPGHGFVTSWSDPSTCKACGEKAPF
jgi:hypothetical protein